MSLLSVGDRRLRVVDSSVHCARDSAHEAFGYPADLPERQIALIELTIPQLAGNDTAHQEFDLGGSRFHYTPGSRLDGVSQHHNRGFFAPRLRPAVSELVFECVPGLFLFGRLVVKVLHQRGSVVLLDDVHHNLRQSVFLGYLKSVLDVRRDNQRRERWVHPIMHVLEVLVLDEEVRPSDLADIMVI